MPGKKSKNKNDESSEETNEESGGGGKGKMLPAIVLSVGLLGAGYFVGGGMGGGASEAPVAEAAEPEPVEEKRALGMLVPLEAVNVNLADGHFLRIAVSLELSEDATAQVESKQSKDATYEYPVAPAADLLLTTFSGRSIENLSTPAGRTEAREAYAAAIESVYQSDVVSLYFTEFVMQ
ncbi:MAG: flagellar basal body-associated FliL family protein [Actinomycetota bacterium]